MLRRFESQVRQQQQDLDYKNHELETVRKELAELWTTHNQLTEHSSQQADLIRQIQSLQTDTQKSKREIVKLRLEIKDHSKDTEIMV